MERLRNLFFLLALSAQALAYPTTSDTDLVSPLENTTFSYKSSQEILAIVETSRIVNGFEVDILKVPYHVALRKKVSSGWAYTCGGAIITSRAVLTAAHCVTDLENIPSYLRVIAGTQYRLTGGEKYNVERIIPHEDYNPSNLYHDIAMLITSKFISFRSYMRSIPFAPREMNVREGTEALVTGFGAVEYQGTASSVLLAAKVFIVSQEKCSRAYTGIADIPSGMICANATNPPRDACQGDSGGPLVSEGKLIGIVSWGEGCADSVYPGVYTRVSEYNSWITSKLSDNELSL